MQQGHKQDEDHRCPRCRCTTKWQTPHLHNWCSGPSSLYFVSSPRSQPSTEVSASTSLPPYQLHYKCTTHCRHHTCFCVQFQQSNCWCKWCKWCWPYCCCARSSQDYELSQDDIPDRGNGELASVGRIIVDDSGFQLTRFQEFYLQETKIWLCHCCIY